MLQNATCYSVTLCDSDSSAWQPGLLCRYNHRICGNLTYRICGKPNSLKPGKRYKWKSVTMTTENSCIVSRVLKKLVFHRFCKWFFHRFCGYTCIATMVVMQNSKTWHATKYVTVKTCSILYLFFLFFFFQEFLFNLFFFTLFCLLHFVIILLPL